MHAAERQKLILDLISDSGFVTYRELERQIAASPATIRRDLTQLEQAGALSRVHGGAKQVEGEAQTGYAQNFLTGTPFEQSITQNIAEKEAIGRAAAALCRKGEGIIIDGGTTTFQMCSHLAPLQLQVLTNSLHIVLALSKQPDTRILVPSGTLFREQNIILAPSGEDCMPRFHAQRLFMGAAAVGSQGVIQSDAVLVASQRRLIERAEEVILLVDASKFDVSSGAIVCGLEEIDVIVTAGDVPEEVRQWAAIHDIEVIVAPVGRGT